LAGRWENHVLTTALLLALEVALAGHARFVDGVTFLGHAVVGGVLFLLLAVLFAVHVTYIETCWHSTQLLDTDRLPWKPEFKRELMSKKSALMKKQRYIVV
jgi:hypothetical protein